MSAPKPNSIGTLRTTSDSLLRDLDVLATLEEQKRDLASDDPRLVEVATRIEEIAQRVLNLTVRQRELTEVVTAETAQPGVSASTIAESPRPVAAVIADWREAERRVAAAEPGSVEAAESQAVVERLREEYRRAWEAAQGR
jgi:hypothetical protein